MKWENFEATGSFFLLIAWLNYLDRQMILPLALTACTLHELGHYGMIRALGGSVRQLRLSAIGAEMILERPLSYWQEGVAALAGPAVNLLLARLFCASEHGTLFAGLNLVLGCFNLLPIAGLDGGRVFHCALCLIAGPDIAQGVGECLSCLFTALLLIGGILLLGTVQNTTLLFVALWLIHLEFSRLKERK